MSPETPRRPRVGSPGTATKQVDETIASVPPRYDVLAGLRRRHLAALRLPPLWCGRHRDPLHPGHLAGDCHRAVNRAAA